MCTTHGVMAPDVVLITDLVTYVILPPTVYVLLTLRTEILMTAIAEPGRRTVPGYSAGPTAQTTLLEHPLHSSLALELFESPLHSVTRQTQPDLVLVIADLSPATGPQYTVTGVTGILILVWLLLHPLGNPLGHPLCHCYSGLQH